MTTPDPVAFNLFGIEVRWYGILIATGMILALLIGLKKLKKYDIPEDEGLNFFLIMVPSVIIGARLWYVLFEWSYYSLHPSEIIAVWNGGLAIQGGLIAGGIAGVIFCKIRKIPVLRFADAAIAGVPLAQAIGRWGNFFNQEAYGTETTLPWAITVYDSAKGYIQVHPTFLYESIWDLLVFGFMWLYDAKWKKCDGEVLFVYMIGYSVGRFFIESLRTDSLMFYGMRMAQLTSVAMIVGGIIGMILVRKNNVK